MDDIFPQALMIGVSDDKFWDMNPKSLEPYIKAFSRKQELIAGYMWQMGAYVRLAVGSVLSKDCKYPTSPPKFLTQEQKQEEIRRKFLNRMEEINARFEDGG